MKTERELWSQEVSSRGRGQSRQPKGRLRRQAGSRKDRLAILLTRPLAQPDIKSTALTPVFSLSSITYPCLCPRRCVPLQAITSTLHRTRLTAFSHHARQEALPTSSRVPLQLCSPASSRSMSTLSSGILWRASYA
ncbi:hypothetical protein AcW1_005807 [Taiwanofungus camphoratus]|nr:hypothetical protein AcW2_004566 [Antrodia cinnamomea]KAI0950497.1 hypothetical protein AcV7_008943 [Antrodia cinnamomea]KAI0957402.1 hypothetical protein AcW1_005807 [Antrodia cinnamomea]